MATRRTIPVSGAVDHAKLTDALGNLLSLNEFTGVVIRGDEIVFQFTLFQEAGSVVPYDIPNAAGLELIITSAFQVNQSSQVVMYADDTQFQASLWADFDRDTGKVACQVTANTINLLAALGTAATGTFRCALIMTPVAGVGPIVDD